MTKKQLITYIETTNDILKVALDTANKTVTGLFVMKLMSYDKYCKLIDTIKYYEQFKQDVPYKEL